MIRAAFLVDASKEIGLGHAIRSMTLGAELDSRGCEVLFVGSGLREVQSLSNSFSKLSIHEFRSQNHLGYISRTLEWKPDLVVVDGYHFAASVFVALASGGVQVGVIDDNGETKAIAPSFVLNQNAHAARGMYPDTWVGTEFLLGLDYLLLREEVGVQLSQPKGVRRSFTLVSMGGTDSRNIAYAICAELRRDGFEVALPIEQSRPATHDSYHNERGNITLFPAREYLRHLRKASNAILAGGSALYEAICLGVPTVAVAVAENQIRLAEALMQQSLIAGLIDYRQGSKRVLLTQVSRTHSALQTSSFRPISGSASKYLYGGKGRAVSHLLARFGKS